MLHACIIAVIISIAIVTSLLKNGISDIVLSCTVTLNDCLNQVLWHIGIICQELLGILWQAIATITEAWVVIVGTDTWIESNSIDNGLGIESLDLGVSALGNRGLTLARSGCLRRQP